MSISIPVHALRCTRWNVYAGRPANERCIATRLRLACGLQLAYIFCTLASSGVAKSIAEYSISSDPSSKTAC